MLSHGSFNEKEGVFVNGKMLVRQQSVKGINLLCKSKEEGTIKTKLQEKRNRVRRKFYGFVKRPFGLRDAIKSAISLKSPLILLIFLILH